MTRKAIQYVTEAAGGSEWEESRVIPLQHALVILDAAMAQKDLRPQSRCNYRSYLRTLYKVLEQEGIDIADDAGGRFWPEAPSRIPRRAQVAYDRFVKWAIGRNVWPMTVSGNHLLEWSRHEKAKSNAHWRKDYERLQVAWQALAADGKLRDLVFAPLPAKLNAAYAIAVENWPEHLREEWKRMCCDATAPLRKGGMRAWREVTHNQNERRLSQLLGWYQIHDPAAVLTDQTWATLLTAGNCQDYINWLVLRNGKATLNPSHTAFLRMIRGLHRFLLGSEQSVIDEFHEIAKRCDVEERDKADRMVPYPALQSAYEGMLAEVMTEMKKNAKASQADRKRIASMQVDLLILGLLVGRAPRSANIIGIRIDRNLVVTDGGYDLRFLSSEMKGHRKFETSLPAELVPIVEDYLRVGYRAVTGKMPATGDLLMVNSEGRPFERTAFSSKVIRMSLRLLGKPVNAHLYRHIVATHAAQVWKLTPTELAAFLAHRSPQTCMKFYEVTNPTLAAAKVDDLRKCPD
jgi:site-specific recombinase XerD